METWNGEGLGYASHGGKSQGVLGELRRGSRRSRTVHTEDGHKCTIESFRKTTVCAGFSLRAVSTDPTLQMSIHGLET